MTDPRKIILRMLCKTSDNFTETELGQVHFCGSFASCMKAEIEFACVHDIDILVDGPNMAVDFGTSWIVYSNKGCGLSITASTQKALEIGKLAMREIFYTQRCLH